MKGKRSKRYPVPSGTQFTEGEETFTIVGPISDEQFVDYANRWPGANRLLRNREDTPFLFASADTKHWVIFDEFGYPVAKSGIAVMGDVIGDGGSFTVGGYESHAEKYGDIQFLQRGFFNKLQEFRMPYAKNLAETEKKIIVFALSNDAPWRLQSYRKLGFEILPHTEKHPLLPDRYYQRFQKDATKYGVWVPKSLDDPAMKKAWGILKSRMSSKAKKLTDEIMADGEERSVKEITTLMYRLIQGNPNSVGKQTIPTRSELKIYLSRNREYVSRRISVGGKRITFYERVIP
jgi:hypothetical protein